eukprot:scaffold232218_cov14-Prasinocladus_malaysianus.AAC.1
MKPDGGFGSVGLDVQSNQLERGSEVFGVEVFTQIHVDLGLLVTHVGRFSPNHAIQIHSKVALDSAFEASLYVHAWVDAARS